MKVLLAYPAPDEIKDCRFGYSLQLLYISSDLKNHGHDVLFVDFSFEKYSRQKIRALLVDVDCLVVDVDAFPLKRSVNIKNAERLCRDAREISTRIRIFGVGKQCTLENQRLPFVDLTIAGDPELAISDLLNGVPDDVRFLNVGSLPDMNSLPIPDYGILPAKIIRGIGCFKDMRLQPSALMETSRGCPGVCSFCQRKGWANGVVYQTIDRVVEVFKCLADSGIRNVWFIDENFTGDLDRAKALLRQLGKANRDRTIKCSISSWTHIDEDFLSLACEAGISIMSFGIESVVLRNQEFFGKRIDMKRFRRMLEFADNLGIYTVGNFIIGTPFDTHDTISANLDFAISSSLDSVNVKTLDYMMGADLYNALPRDLAGLIHVRASKETGLCRFSEYELRQIARSFLFRFNLTRASKLTEKIAKFGPPYHKRQGK